MSLDKINILVTFDQNYILPFKVMLQSLVTNNQEEDIHIFLLHSDIPLDNLYELSQYCESLNVEMTSLKVERETFRNAPVSKRYPQEMYYRLLASYFLPESLEKILYIDPDILVINSLRPLWDLQLEDCVFAAASHTGITNVVNDLNRIRLQVEHDYFNSGVILMDLKKARHIVKMDDIFDCVREHGDELLLPDQDVFNYLYGTLTKQINDEVWNYDARYYSSYFLRSNGQCDINWIMKNTVFLHFCGAKKPWKDTYTYRFDILYKHYMQLADRINKISILARDF